MYKKEPSEEDEFKLFLVLMAIISIPIFTILLILRLL
jgi:hypothetical protein